MLAVMLASTIAQALAATAQRSPEPAHYEHHVGVDLGVPLPLSVYGYRSKGGARGLCWLASLAVEYRYSIVASADIEIQLGGWASAANVHGTDGKASADVYFVSAGLIAFAEFPLSSRRSRASFLIGVGLGASFSGIVVDDQIALHTTALGGTSRARLQLPIFDSLVFSIGMSVDVFSPPLNRSTWFNSPLRETVVISPALGLAAGW